MKKLRLLLALLASLGAGDPSAGTGAEEASPAPSRAPGRTGELAPERASGSQPPLFEGLGTYTRQITTDSPQAQRYFNQGLAFLHAFNHDEAIRSFQEAARLDPECAMAHWGISLACGPHINNPAVPEARAELAWRELELARRHAPGAGPVEQALIQALGRRYALPQPEDRRPLDAAYAEAMRKVHREHPADPDVSALFAEALMDLRPWDLWTEKRQPQPGTEEIVTILESTLKEHPFHPLANHLYIHAVEASLYPERAAEAANRLRDLQPGLGHNTHMPSHIDVLMGRWHEAVEANDKAIRADLAYREASGHKPDFSRLYMAHNRHMLAYAALMTGQSELALTHIRAMVAEMPRDWVRQNAGFADAFVAMPYEVLIRFGRWDAILSEPPAGEGLPLTSALRHAARGIAFAAQGNPGAARREQEDYLRGREAVPDGWVVGINPASAVLELVTRMLEGEILYREGRVEESLAELGRAVAAEDGLRYDEPPGWILPVRHALGATLMQENRLVEAQRVYEEDLERRPGNGWSLFGLAESLTRQNRHVEAMPVREQFEEVWRKADVRIRSSCLCQPGLAGLR